jgi:hypothetical protein
MMVLNAVDTDQYVDSVRNQVLAESNAIALPMRELREGCGFGRLGPHVCAEISRRLEGVGLGHAPDSLPEDQRATVLIYRLGTEVADVANAVLHPSDAGAAALRSATGTEANQVLKQVRALVCD